MQSECSYLYFKSLSMEMLFDYTGQKAEPGGDSDHPLTIEEVPFALGGTLVPHTGYEFIQGLMRCKNRYMHILRVCACTQATHS